LAQQAISWPDLAVPEQEAALSSFEHLASLPLQQEAFLESFDAQHDISLPSFPLAS